MHLNSFEDTAGNITFYLPMTMVTKCCLLMSYPMKFKVLSDLQLNQNKHCNGATKEKVKAE